MNMKEVLSRLIIKYDILFRIVLSGSKWEGFCFDEFDIDVMEYLFVF